ncbi:MAG: Gfo/Idh/MocA family oxidoreductase, partial [Opitutaceae bacterium]|nr:Gfo/Idh/MocA family oxidoreductase [Verrucomicrobiales bacterium]
AIVMEKPMALSLAEAREVSTLASEAGVQLIVSHQHKYGAHWRHVKELIDRGELGEIRTIHLTSKGWMAQYATHLIDYGLWLAGSPDILWATGHASGWNLLEPSHPSPNYFWGQLALANDVRLLIECGPSAPDQPGYRQPKTFSLDFWMNAGATVVGTKGEANVVVGRGWSAVTSQSGVIGSNDVAFDGVNDTVGLYKELANTLLAGSDTHSCRAVVALRGYEALVAICRSTVNRQTVPLPLSDSSEAIGQLQAILNPAN